VLKTIHGPRPSVDPLKRGYTPTRTLGLDTETVCDAQGNVRILTLQACGDDYDARLIWTDNEHALADLMEVLDEWCRKGEHNVGWFHNLTYDLTAILLGFPLWLEELVQNGQIKITWSGIGELEIFAGRTWWVRGKFGQHRTFSLFDSCAFTYCSLKACESLFNLPIGKLPTPSGLGQRVFTEADSEFKAYAIRDAELEYLIGKAITEQHAEFDIPVACSVASMSSRIFRRDYLTESLPRMPWQFEQDAIKAFHGGISQALPGYYETAHEYDIASAYPAALLELGLPESIRLVNKYEGENAIYLVRGFVRDPVYPALWANDFTALSRTDAAFVTGYELASAMESGEWCGRVLRGYVVIFKNDPSLQRFVIDFYLRKEQARREGNRLQLHVYKRILNSLFGKFIQSNADTRFGTYRPGGLWCPMLAALCTGRVRAKIHRLQHLGRCVHTATDAIKTPVVMPTGEGLGELRLEASGECLVLRPRLYAHYNRETDSWKLAAHGLNDNPRRAWQQIIKSGQTVSNRLCTARESRCRNVPPLSPMRVTTILKGEIPPYPESFAEKLLTL
jgi:hypothetical protein